MPTEYDRRKFLENMTVVAEDNTASNAGFAVKEGGGLVFIAIMQPGPIG